MGENLAGRLAVVTGGASGIGEACGLTGRPLTRWAGRLTSDIPIRTGHR